MVGERVSGNSASFRGRNSPDVAHFFVENGFLERRGRNIAVPSEKILLLNEILNHFI